jgi:ABC-type phosphate transport system substrate-binding protein
MKTRYTLLVLASLAAATGCASADQTSDDDATAEELKAQHSVTTEAKAAAAAQTYAKKFNLCRCGVRRVESCHRGRPARGSLSRDVECSVKRI